MKILNELRKLLTVKAIWIIYLLLVIFVLANLRTNTRSREFARQFTEHHGQGPYSIELLEDYMAFNKEINNSNCRSNQSSNCDSYLSPRSKELRDLYPSLNHSDLSFVLSYFPSNSNENSNASLKKYIEEQKNFDKTPIEAFFFNKMASYHVQNPRVIDIENGLDYFLYVYYPPSLNTLMIVGGAISFIMMVLSISQALINDQVDYIILSTKTGRKILKSKYISCLLFSIIVSTICFILLFYLGMNQDNWQYFLNSKMVDHNFQYFYWYDFKFWQFLLSAFLMSVITNLMISTIICSIAVFSKKLINTIASNFLLIAIIIGLIYFFDLKDYDTLISQFIRVTLNHTPFGNMYNNINMFEYSYFYKSSYLTYREYPFIYLFINLIFLTMIYLFSYRYYKKVNIK